MELVKAKQTIEKPVSEMSGYEAWAGGMDAAVTISRSFVLLFIIYVSVHG